MSKQILKNVRCYHGVRDISGDTNKLSLQAKREEKDVTTWASDDWKEKLPGLAEFTVAYSGFASFGTGEIDADAWNELGTTSDLFTAALSAADGSLAWFGNAVELEYTPIDGAIGDAAEMSVNGGSDGRLIRGQIIHPGSADRTSSGTGTGQQLTTPSSTQRLYAALHVFGVSGGSPTLDVVVQSDDNGGFTTPTGRITFAQATGRGSQFLSLPGPLAGSDDRFRITYTIGGSSPHFRFAVAVGIA